MFARVRENAGKDWLPTPVRAVAQALLLLQSGDPVIKEALEAGDGLEGNVEGFRAYEEVWKDFELQATAAVVYAGLLEREEILSKARKVLCKVSFYLYDTPSPWQADENGVLKGVCRYRRMPLIGWMPTPVRRASFSTLGWRWSTTLAFPTPLWGSTKGPLF
jgi:hypothetical protein